MLDGIYFGGNFEPLLKACRNIKRDCTVLAAKLEANESPRPFGWLIRQKENGKHRVIKILEKPSEEQIRYFGPDPEGGYLVQTHMYFYGPEVFEEALQLKLSQKGEFEITALHERFRQNGRLSVEILERNQEGKRCVWDDAGTAPKLLKLAIRVYNYQRRNRTLVGSPHLQALKNGWIDANRIERICEPFRDKGIEYYDVLLETVQGKRTVG